METVVLQVVNSLSFKKFFKFLVLGDTLWSLVCAGQTLCHKITSQTLGLVDSCWGVSVCGGGLTGQTFMLNFSSKTRQSRFGKSSLYKLVRSPVKN